MQERDTLPIRLEMCQIFFRAMWYGCDNQAALVVLYKQVVTVIYIKDGNLALNSDANYYAGVPANAMKPY